MECFEILKDNSGAKSVSYARVYETERNWPWTGRKISETKFHKINEIVQKDQSQSMIK